ncbi:MAG: hypothetical protein PHO10_03605 [Gemmiger sp.]|nr:hypothetical protein [Gemmiger sp.]
MKLQRTFAAAALVLACTCATAGAVGTGAYAAAAHRTHNVITAGNIQIALYEKFDQGGKLVDWPLAQGITGALPGQTISKIVYVTNTGGYPAWVRVQATPGLTLADGTTQPPGGLVGFAHTDAAGVSHPGYNEADWLYDATGGYYLYRTALAPGATTTPLFSGVTLSQTMDARYAGATVTVEVAAQAVQSKNNGGAATQAVGWPTAT